jgi:hypothetical protein
MAMSLNLRDMLIRAFAAAIEPALELADADGVLGLGLFDADGQAGCGAERGVHEAAAPEFHWIFCSVNLGTICF